MNDFEWLRQARALNTSEPPARDLWPAIAERIGAAPARRRHPLLPWAMAASIGLLSLLAGGIAQRLQVPAGTSYAHTVARQSWQPQDPRLTGAAVELHAARAELSQAIAQAPRAAFLRRLMQRTRTQEHQLRQFGGHAG
jgi:hypothetical protein